MGHDANEANHLMSSLDWMGAVKDVQAAVDHLKSLGVEKIGVVGFCMGGALTIASAVHVKGDGFNLGVNAGICFYGIPPAQLAKPEAIAIPMQFHFGDKDKSPGFSDVAAADQLRTTLQGAGRDVKEYAIDQYQVPAFDRSSAKLAEFLRYKHADHAFMNEEGPAFEVNQEAAKFGMAQSVAFFKTLLH